MNVDADAMAGQYQDLYGQDRPIVLLTPRTRVLLHLPEGTITSSLSATLRHAYCGPPLVAYIRKKNQWSEATADSINWQAHGSALRKQIPRRIHFVKYVHDILPTHSQQNKLDKGKRTCPCCPSKHEDRDHILRCPSTERNRWRHKLLAALSEVCSTHHTYEPLKQLLIDSVRQWLYPGQDMNQVQHCAQYPAELHPLIRFQTSIGWRQLFNGRFCKQWGDIQSAHLYRIRHHLPDKHNTGQKWQVAIITVIWENWYNLWKMRNADVHGRDSASRVLAEKREVARRLAMIYDQRNHMEPSVQELLYSDIQTHLKQPTWVIQNWLAIQGPGFMTSIRAVTAKAIQNVRSIRSYFTPVTTVLPVG